jgi:branched-chain amino acid transport system substrate-binding protein
LALEGNAALNGIGTAVAWVNDHGGVTVNGNAYKFAFMCYDDQSLQAGVSALYTRLVQQDGAQFLLAPYSSGLTSAAAPIADQLERVMLSHGGASDALFSVGRKNFVGVLSPATRYLRTAIDALNATSPDDSIAVIHEGDTFSTTAARAGIAYAESLGLTVVYNASYVTGTQDLKPQLTAARNAQADVLIGGGHFADGQLIMTQLAEVGWTPKLISLLVAVTEPKFQEIFGTRANNVTGPSQWEAAVGYSPDLANEKGVPWYGPNQTEFVQLYRSRTGGASPSYHAAEAAAAILVLAEGIRTADSLETAAVRQALGEMTLMTFFGDYDIDETGLQIAHQMVLIQWQDGQLKVVAPAEVAEASLQYPYTGS